MLESTALVVMLHGFQAMISVFHWFKGYDVFDRNCLCPMQLDRGQTEEPPVQTHDCFDSAYPAQGLTAESVNRLL
jgi:hypothetical protein